MRAAGHKQGTPETHQGERLQEALSPLFECEGWGSKSALAIGGKKTQQKRQRNKHQKNNYDNENDNNNNNNNNNNKNNKNNNNHNHQGGDPTAAPGA